MSDDLSFGVEVAAERSAMRDLLIRCRRVLLSIGPHLYLSLYDDLGAAIEQINDGAQADSDSARSDVSVTASPSPSRPAGCTYPACMCSPQTEGGDAWQVDCPLVQRSWEQKVADKPGQEDGWPKVAPSSGGSSPSAEVAGLITQLTQTAAVLRQGKPIRGDFLLEVPHDLLDRAAALLERLDRQVRTPAEVERQFDHLHTEIERLSREKEQNRVLLERSQSSEGKAVAEMERLSRERDKTNERLLAWWRAATPYASPEELRAILALSERHP